MRIEKVISKKELIENKLSHLDLFSYYMPWKFELNKNCSNPFVSKDSNPSMRIYSRNGEYFFKCYNSQQKGDVWTFLMELSQSTFDQVCDGIIADFGLLETSGAKLERVVSELPKIEKKASRPPKIIAEVYSKWQQRHIDYLAEYHLIPEDLNFCSDTKCYPLKQFYLNSSKFNVNNKEVGFVYNVNKFNKIYLPNRPKDQKWWSNIPFSYIHGLDNLKGCELGILSKSIKDGALLSKYITPCVSILQAENSTAITQEHIDYIKINCKNLLIAMDTDPQGKKTSYELCEIFGARHINIPDRLLKYGASDFSDWAKLEGFEAVIEHFKKKGII